MEMDSIDRKLLDIIQGNFPLVPRPYAHLAHETGIDENEAWTRIKKLREQGIIRRIGANFQSGKLGFVSTLCAARVPAGKMEKFIQIVNKIPGVTHNYERDHEYNIWFTLIGESKERVQDILDGIARQTGIEILNLPATRTFKIKVDFAMSERDKD